MGILDGLMGNTGSLIGAGLGLLAGGSSKGNTATQTAAQLDPRIAKYVYGENGSGGLLGDAQNIYSQQMQQGGLNDIQRQGLDMRLNYLRSPQYTNSYQTMMNQGMGLMNRGVAGNPFTQGGGGSQAPSVPSAGYQYAPPQAQAPVYRPAQQAPVQAQNPVIRESQGGGGGPVDGGSSGGSTPGGQGIMSNQTISALFGANALANNPAMQAYSPFLAGLMGWGSGAVLDSQTDAMGRAGNALSATQGLSNLGIGTYADANGNVFSFSSPETIARADRDEFGRVVGGGYDSSGYSPPGGWSSGGFSGISGAEGDPYSY